MLPLIDAHIHTWDLTTQELPWLSGTPAAFRRSYPFDELTAFYAAEADVAYLGAVHIEADVADPAAEVDRVAALVGSDPLALGFVAHARLSEDLVVPAGAAGVREVLHNPEIPRGRCLEPSFLAGLRALASQGASFDAVIRTPELPDLLEALEQVPQVRVIIDHLGNATEVTDQLRAVFAGLAALPNTYCKVSGLDHRDPAAEKLMELAADTFGTNRLMYCSNWPVVELYSTPGEHLAAVRRFFGDDADVFAGTARRAYQLKGH